MANILYLKLQQAKKEYQTYSSKMFDSFSNSNIDKNLSKKISAVSYWLEILETKIKDCSQSSSQDPTPVIFYLNENCNLDIYSDIVESYIHIRNKNNTFIPIAKVRSSINPSTGQALTSEDRKSTRLNSSHGYISYAVFCLKKKKKQKLVKKP
mgnify:CR=1 FL=1